MFAVNIRQDPVYQTAQRLALIRLNRMCLCEQS